MHESSSLTSPPLLLSEADAACARHRDHLDLRQWGKPIRHLTQEFWAIPAHQQYHRHVHGRQGLLRRASARQLPTSCKDGLSVLEHPFERLRRNGLNHGIAHHVAEKRFHASLDPFAHYRIYKILIDIKYL